MRVLHRAGVRVAFRTAADGFVYAFVASADSMDSAFELGRVQKDLMDRDPQLWADFKAMAGEALKRIVADLAGAHGGDEPRREAARGNGMTHDPINHPKHYTSHPSGVECIAVTEHMSFNIGNAMKYLWRADEKGAPLDDLKKAAWYIAREIQRRQKAQGMA